MQLLLDTCTFLWMIASPDKLSETARKTLTRGTDRLLINQTSAWEIQIKYKKGQLALKATPKQIIEKALTIYPIEYEKIADEAIWHLQKLPDIHKDPFDRLLISHALTQGYKLVTPDPEIAKYPVPIIW
jgi:PIN domain nuclease of toxin-antitoxin system